MTEAEWSSPYPWGKARFVADDYHGWRTRRFEAIRAHYGDAFFPGKTMLELGAGCGHFGRLFQELGCKVTCWEGRELNVLQGRILHPQLEFHIKDLDHDRIEADYDIILHQGLLYHLTNLDEHLQNVAEHCRYLFLETHVVDVDEEVVYLEEEPGIDELCDSSVHGLGSRPSLPFVENRLRELDFEIMRCPNRERLDYVGYYYSWEPANTGDQNLRMLWFAEKKDVSGP